jgi:hypothetical protein
MTRNVSSPMLSSLLGSPVRPGFLAALTFRSTTEYVWTGLGNLVYGGNTYRGIGSLGKIGAVAESTELRADGTTVTLSGIDPGLLAESLTDIQIGAPAAIYFAAFDQTMAIVGTPYPLFVGTVDQPVVQIGLDEMAISLKLENKLANLQRANMRRYTAADQGLYFPNDTAFVFVELLNDQALKWTP